ncbi:tetratricopeptide repeat protein [Celeribacter litoreus]|uniref:tetratricopeptide repeat protein n=1 Tax=Celeribacter litoreus TaxID=2876714 RepID=UPI001CCCFF2A|nr:tetratricopeptide repeat protein [Celeribacter litoreus]MCA0043044.1 tetratricopeptide repeat protein [Celeribacter litoreus]
MKGIRQFHKCAVAFWLILAGSSVSAADLDELFDQLAEAQGYNATMIEQEIALEMSRSGSDAMDLLLERGRAAIDQGDLSGAIGHLTALVDHAPDFAEGYNARATAYYLSGLYGPAIYDIAEVLNRVPRHFGALSGLALILEETGETERALDVLYVIEGIHPNMSGLQERISYLELLTQGTAL